ncbi:MAG: hypothetical protein IK057_03760 [Clostridia bacterium]|nr:hypothetical protein [Clostridia bacterium]
MKKAISILLAVATMAIATSAMAATGTADLTSGKDAGGVQYNRNSNDFVGSQYDTTTMPCFRPGDTVKFDVTGATEGDDVTLITYKLGQGNNLTTSTVQYVNQYDDIAGTTKNVAYKVRNLESGVYQLDIKVGENAIKTVYYKVGTVAATMIPANGNTSAYIIKENADGSYTAGFVGKVTIDIADTTLADIGSNPGFSFTNGKRYNFTDEQVADFEVANVGAYDGEKVNRLVNSFLTGEGTNLTGTGSEAELYGGYSFVYGMNIYNINSAANAEAISATAVTDAE